MSLISKYEKLQDVLVRVLKQSREKDSRSSATFDLDDALLELGIWHDMISNRVEDIYSDAEACRLTHLALDTALDACQALETTSCTRLSSIFECGPPEILSIIGTLSGIAESTLRTSQTILQDKQLHEILRHANRENHQKPSQEFPILGSQHEIGGAYHADEQVKETLAVHKHAVSVQKENLAEDNLSRLTSQHELASTKREDGQTKKAVTPLSSTIVARTLATCTRCRVRKTRCDPNLPKCGHCERTGSICEYYDSSKGRVLNRNYVIYLQHKVKELEEELEREERRDNADDPEAIMRAAIVRIQDGTEPRYLGASSDVTTTRLIIHLAKQSTDSKSIKEIVSDVRAQQIKELYSQEQAKPTSKVYPVTSNVAAPDLPNKGLAKILVDLYILKVQPMYPVLHEPTLEDDINAVYNEEVHSTPYQNFVSRMIIAVSLQKMDTQYAGLADSFYLAALKYLEPCVRPMDLSTLQCFVLMAEYSFLTPTRTAIYYVIGIAVRLVQALGLHEEKTITRGRDGNPADPLEIDMRRRLFWCIIVMEFGLSHALGRPAILATDQEHFDVNWFETCEDKYITRGGIDPAATPTLKKRITIHFFKMRLLQLEIRRKLYRSKQSEPSDDSDPWFHQMNAKLEVWRDSSPNKDEGSGFDKRWFIVRYNTMLAFLYRPSLQVPQPSLQAALKCFEACQYNIYIQKEQVDKKSVDLTWTFTQAIFMAINTMLWSLSYVEVRCRHSRESVDRLMKCAIDAIKLASERWPGVTSVVQLYQDLIEAILKVYEKDSDIYSGSNMTSPATVASSSVATPLGSNGAPFGYIYQYSRNSVKQAPPVPYSSGTTPPVVRYPPVTQQNIQAQPGADQYSNNNNNNDNYNQNADRNLVPPPNNMTPSQPTSDMPNQWNHLPNFQHDYTRPQNSYANPDHQHQHQQQHQQQVLYPQIPQHNRSQQPFPAYIGQNNNDSTTISPEPTYSYPTLGAFDPQPAAEQYMQELWELDGNAWNNGLTEAQQQELMESLERDGMKDIQGMIINLQDEE